MSAIPTKFILCGTLFLLTVVTGVWLSRSGKPLNTLIVTLHKLIALGTVVYTIVTIYQLAQNVEISALGWGAVGSSGLLVIALFASGALLSTGKPLQNAILTIHKIAPFFSAISTALILYLLAGGGQ
jgi:hypothetical protein